MDRASVKSSCDKCTYSMRNCEGYRYNGVKPANGAQDIILLPIVVFEGIWFCDPKYIAVKVVCRINKSFSTIFV